MVVKSLFMTDRKVIDELTSKIGLRSFLNFLIYSNTNAKFYFNVLLRFQYLKSFFDD